jgi:hypothetical protein
MSDMFLRLSPSLMKTLPGIILLLFLTTGCDFRRVVVNDPLVSASVQQLTSGTSTMQDVVARLGSPDMIVEGGDGLIFRYRYGDTKTMRVNFGWIARLFLPIFPPVALGKGQNVTHILHVALRPDLTFDHSVIQPPPKRSHFGFWPF